MAATLNMKLFVLAVLVSALIHGLLANIIFVTFSEYKSSPKADFIFLGSILSETNFRDGDSPESGVSANFKTVDVGKRPYKVAGFEKPSGSNVLGNFPKVYSKIFSWQDSRDFDDNIDKENEADIGIPQLDPYKPLRIP